MKIVSLCLLWISIFCASPATAQLVTLSFEGTVDDVLGFTIDGNAAPIDSLFTLDVGINTSMSETGVYAVESVSFTLDALAATYDTTTDWAGLGTTLVATQVGNSIELISDPLFSNPDENFLLGNLTGFGPAEFDDPSTWGTDSSSIFGDVIVRGAGGFDSLDQLSGAAPYIGSLNLTVVPEPVIAPGFGLFVLAVLARRRKTVCPCTV